MWWVLRTKSRNEKKAESRLLKEGLNVYCPKYLSERKWSDRKKRIEIPLFSGYIFVEEDQNIISRLQYIPGVSGFLYFNGTKACVRDSEIENIKTFTGEISKLATQEIVIEVGDTVEINNGSLTGQNGTVYKKTNGLYSIIIENLGIQISARLPKQYLEVV